MLGRRATGQLAAPQNGSYSQHQLAHAEGLRDVVVRADFEADDAVDLLAARGQHDHRQRARLRVVLDGATHLGARNVRQHQVQNHQVGLALAEQT